MTGRRTLLAALAALAIVASLVTDPATESSATETDAQVLGEVEVRGTESGTSDGRSTADQDSAPGLSATSEPTATPNATPTSLPATPTEVPLPPTAIPIPTVPGEPTPAEPQLPALVIPDASPVSEPTAGGGSASVVERGAEAMELISYPWRERLAGWQLEFLGAREGVRGLTYTGERRIEVFIRPGDSAWDIARVVAHELGHAVDLRRNSSDDRERWREQRSLGDAPWWPESGAADFATGAGDWAECFATWQVGSASLSQIGGVCSADDLVLLDELS